MQVDQGIDYTFTVPTAFAAFMESIMRIGAKVTLFIGYVLAVTNAWFIWKFLEWVHEFGRAGSATLDFSSYMSVQAQQNSLLQVYLIVFSIGMAGLAIWGYGTIKQAAQTKAEAKAEEMINQVLKNI